MASSFGSWRRRRQADSFAEAFFGPRAFPSEAWGEDVPEPRLPSRSSGARGGAAFMRSIWSEGAPASRADWIKREDAMVAELVAGNIPDFMRRWVEIRVSRNGQTPVVVVRVLPDYLCVGKDDDYRHLPLDQQSAQKVADAFGAILPTAKICHAVWRRIPWSATINAIPRDYWNTGASRKVPRNRAQTSTAAYDEHSVAIQDKMRSMGLSVGTTIVGHKKDVVLTSNRDASRIAFHGFYDGEVPFEPCMEGSNRANCNKEMPAHPHPEGKGRFSDYSQGVRLVHPHMHIDGVKHVVADVLKDASLASHISAQGVIASPRVPPPTA